jgi:hypothetical protein
MAFRGSRFTLRSVLLVIAVILFVVAAFSAFDIKGISLAWLGMAFFAGSFLFP